MKTVRIYYAGIPAKNNKLEKRQVLEFFHQGVTDGQSTEVHNTDWQPSDLAVMQGWVHEGSAKSPHLLFRKAIIENQQKIKKHTLAIDSNLFLYRDFHNKRNYLRFSLDGIFPTTGNYFTDTVDVSRWNQIKKDIGIDLQPWKNNGKHVLICLQRNGGWSMGGLNVMDWLNSTIDTIQKHSDRKIIVRAHPGDKRVKDYLKITQQNVKVSTNDNILVDFEKTWATVTYNSSPGVASAIEGVPVFVTDPEPKKSQAYDVANFDLSQIENPIKPDRERWIEKISMSHFNFEDLKNGVAWNIIKEYL